MTKARCEIGPFEVFKDPIEDITSPTGHSLRVGVRCLHCKEESDVQVVQSYMPKRRATGDMPT